VSDIEGLKDRVEQAVQQLSSVQGVRQGQNQHLTSLLGNLEEKFQSRTVELDYCNSQIETLIQDNAQLSELLERLVHLIESDRVSGEDDPLIRASTMAATLLHNWTAPEEPGDAATAMPEAFGPPEPVLNVQELVSEASLSDSFEDVSAEELQAEALDGLDVEIPELVAVAIAEAQETDVEEFAVIEDVSETDDAVAVEEVAGEFAEDDVMDEPVAVDLDIPESEDHSDDGLADEIEEDTEASIRAMMARLEAAALDAKFSSEENAGEEPSDSVQVA
jgi:hypothetical protein